MTRHILKKALIAASALTVLAAAPSAMAATEKSSPVKVKSSQKVVKLASNKTLNQKSAKFRNNGRLRNRVSTRSRNNIRRNNFNRRSNLNLLSRSSFNSPFRRTSSLFRSNRGFYSPYRSNIGISFNFGTSGLSRYRWSPSAYSLYRPTYGSFGAYQTRTVCHRVTLEGLYRGHPELISVKQCSNPWDGTYIIQGSERLVGSHW